MNIKVLGSGCTKCKKLEENVRKAVAEKGLTVKQDSVPVVNVKQDSVPVEHETINPAGTESYVTIEKVSDLKTIMGYGVMSTPALVIDEKLVSSGKLLSPKDILKLIG